MILLVISNIVFLVIGLFVGHKIPRTEKIIPNINPIKTIERVKNEFETRKEDERIKIIEQNIDNYDGTGFNQMEIPR